MARIAKEKLNSNNKIENSKKRINKSKSEEVIELNNDLFSFDDEMVIGVNKKEEKKVDKQEINKNKQTKVNKNKNAKNKKKKNNKPNVKNKLSQPQLQLKQKKRKMTLKLIKYTSVFILFISLVIITMFSPIFNIKNIFIEGNEKITKNEIISLSQIQIGENTYKVSKYKVKEKIKENAYIEEVNIKRKLPSEIQISVLERKTNFMIEYGASFVYIDNQGYILEISTEKLELPIIQGIQTANENFIEGSRLQDSDLQKMNTVLKIVEIAQNNEIADLITRIDIENEQDYKILLETKEKIIYLGDNSNLNTKMLSAKAILEKTEGIAGEIFVNMDLNNNYPIFRQRV